MDQEMQSGSQYDCSSFECFATTSTSHQIQESLELQIVNDLQEKYRPRYKSDMILSMEGDQILRCVRDRFGNNHVTLKMTPHIQGKIRVNWLTISDKTGQRYIMPYHIQARDGSHLIPDSNSIIFDINTDDDGFMKLKLGLCKTTWRELEGSQPLSLFQPITDALHTSNILPHAHLSPKRLIREFRLERSQLAFTLCTRGQNESSVPQWHTTVFSNVMTEVSSSFGTQPKKLSHFYMFPSNTDIRNDHEQQLSTVEDTVERKKRQKLDATENMEEPQSTINAESMVNLNCLVSISVESEQSLDKRTWAFVLSTFSQYNLRKLCMSNMETLMGNISWPNQWNLEHLEIDDCTYNSYLAILQHLPHLRTFSMRTWIIDDVDEQALSSSDNTFTAPLESLTMRNCSLSTYYLEALLSLTPSLRYLKLVSAREVFDSFFDNVYWEKLISDRLQKLHKFEFIFFHTYNKKDDSINLDVLVASFRSSFWHDDKRWFIVGAYFLRKNEIWLYTTPIHFPGITDLLRLETSWTNNAYHLTQRPLNRTLDTSLDEVYMKIY
ncbi:hypothetical protein I4U23_011636 [Adineta vaga]|nr:hypothetical protein I4U23_011636 [Adineta vaga]